MDPDVVGKVEGGGVDPQGPAQPPPGPVQQLPEARDQGQPRLQVPADGLDPDATVGFQQAGAVQDGERADVLGPAELVRPQHEQVLGGQTVYAAWLGHDIHPLGFFPTWYRWGGTRARVEGPLQAGPPAPARRRSPPAATAWTAGAWTGCRLA